MCCVSCAMDGKYICIQNINEWKNDICSKNVFAMLCREFAIDLQHFEEKFVICTAFGKSKIDLKNMISIPNVVKTSDM